MPNGDAPAGLVPFAFALEGTGSQELRATRATHSASDGSAPPGLISGKSPPARFGAGDVGVDVGPGWAPDVHGVASCPAVAVEPLPLPGSAASPTAENRNRSSALRPATPRVARSV